MRSLRIRGWLRTAVVADKALPLDGILLYQATRRALGPQDRTLPGMTDRPVDEAKVRVPLACENTGTDKWFYKCSFAQWPGHARFGKAFWEKRVATDHIDIVDMGRSKNITIGSGRYRLYHMPVFYIAALYVDWYAVGELDAVDGLLSDVWAIGKKTSQGWGRVWRWQVEEWAEDWSVQQGGEWMRAVPIMGSFDVGNIQLYGFRPPYWKTENQTLCHKWSL